MQLHKCYVFSAYFAWAQAVAYIHAVFHYIKWAPGVAYSYAVDHQTAYEWALEAAYINLVFHHSVHFVWAREADSS